jgi:hypothetical protein
MEEGTLHCKASPVQLHHKYNYDTLYQATSCLGASQQHFYDLIATIIVTRLHVRSFKILDLDWCL